MNLIVGATGLVGREVCLRLIASGKAVRAFVRASSNPDAVAALRAAGAEIVVGDLKDARTSSEACKGVTTVISTASSTLSRQEGDFIDSVDRDGQLRLVEAARERGVQRFIFVSFGHENAPAPSALADAKASVERALIDSGMEYTIVRPSFFMEVWLSPALGFDAVNATATIYGSGERALSWISFRDVAALTATFVDNPAARNAILEIGGPESLTPNEVVRIFEEKTGRKFNVQYVPEAALRGQYEVAADPMQRSFAVLMLTYATGDSINMTKTLAEFPVKLTSVRDFASSGPRSSSD